MWRDRAKLDGVKDVGLFLGRQANTLGIAPAFDVEDAIIGPAVLIVANQGALGVGGQSGLASTRKTEEDSHITVDAFVGGGVQSEDVVLDRHFVEEDGKDAFLHFAGVFGTEDDHLFFFEINGHGGC